MWVLIYYYCSNQRYSHEVCVEAVDYKSAMQQYRFVPGCYMAYAAEIES